MLRFERPEFYLGLGLLGLTAVVAWGSAVIPTSVYAQVGPAVFPWAVTAGLVVLSLLVIWQGLSGGWDCGEEAEGPIDQASIVVLLAGLVANVAAIEYIGFILSAVILFSATAWAFGSRRIARDAAIGFLVAFIAYAGFDGVLGYKIGAGGLDDRVSAAIEHLWKLFRPG